MDYIIWEPSGIIMDLGFYQLRWYSLLFSSGLFIAYILMRNIFKDNNLSDDKFDKLAMYIILATVIGARLGHCFFYDWAYYSNHLLEIILPFRFEPSFKFVGFQGLASHGGTVGVFLALVLYSKLYKVNLYWILDKAALLAPICSGFIRMGNLMNSEIIGKETDVPWAFVFKHIDNIPRHPSQLYEALAYFAIFGILAFLDKSLKRQNGFIFGVFLALLFSARIIIEFFKANQKAFEADMILNMGQMLSIPLVLAGIIVLVMRNKQGNRTPFN